MTAIISSHSDMTFSKNTRNNICTPEMEGGNGRQYVKYYTWVKVGRPIDHFHLHFQAFSNVVFII